MILVYLFRLYKSRKFEFDKALLFKDKPHLIFKKSKLLFYFRLLSMNKKNNPIDKKSFLFLLFYLQFQKITSSKKIQRITSIIIIKQTFNLKKNIK